MVEGLLRRMNSYAFANGHQMTNIVWYGSTTELWAHTDTLRHFLEKTKPTFVMISIGSNEQFIKDVAGREACIRHIISQLGATPFVWIGVPAWRTDTGINELTRQTVGKSRYFDSRGLTLQRGSDRRHPTFSAASLWMDSIARWMASPETAHPIRMNKPTDRRRHSYKTYILQPLKN
ncbi:MAG: SGNH/GDSL hydrolase family protein [Bacteroidaceae bacterium]|nr:SGNH/GDSL hydrolase family protein [Bacteroidaceae bacterium]